MKITKMFSKKIYMSSPIYVLVFSIFLVLFFSAPSIFLKFNTNINGDLSFYKSVLSIMSELLLSVCITAPLIYLFSFSRVILKIAGIIFISCSCIFSYYMIFYHVNIDEFFIATIFEVPLKDAGSAISIGLFVYYFIFGLIPIYFWVYIIRIRYYGKFFLSIIIRYVISLSVAFSVVCTLFVFSYLLNKDIYSNPQWERVIKTSLSIYMPVNYVAGLYQYFLQLRPNTNYKTINISKKYPFSFYDSKFKDNNYTVFLIIGESARAKNQQLNGYYRETNPRLSKEKNLINFSNMRSCNTYTVYSVNCMLSYKTAKEFRLDTKESNLISAFKSLGFKTYYFSTQPLYNETSLSYFLAKDADVKVFANQVRLKTPSGNNIYDEYLLDFVRNIQQNKRQKKLIILHLMTSHTPYQTRYPKDFEVFKSSKNNIIDEYDNSLIYTDYIISNLIDMYRNQKAFLYFASDHGESLGENGIYLHAARYDIAPIDQLHIFSFVWASSSMVELMGEKYSKIKSKKDELLSHDNLFPSMFDCLGIKSSIVNKSLSLCR